MLFLLSVFIYAISLIVLSHTALRTARSPITLPLINGLETKDDRFIVQEWAPRRSCSPAFSWRTIRCMSHRSASAPRSEGIQISQLIHESLKKNLENETVLHAQNAFQIQHPRISWYTFWDQRMLHLSENVPKSMHYVLCTLHTLRSSHWFGWVFFTRENL